jgi:biopolymer transport protein ExbB
LALLVLSLSAISRAQAPSGEGNPAAAPVATPAPAKKPPLTFFQIIFSGGPLGIANMVVLIGLSLTAAYLVFDNLMLIRKPNLIPAGLSEDVRRLVSENQIAQAQAACKEEPSFLSFVAATRPRRNGRRLDGSRESDGRRHRRTSRSAVPPH